MTTTIEALITAAALAGRYREDARENPDCAGGWERSADRWHAVVTRLAGDLVEADARQTRNRARLPSPVTVARRDRS